MDLVQFTDDGRLGGTRDRLLSVSTATIKMGGSAQLPPPPPWI